MSGFKSVAIISVVAGKASRNRRVTIPVPQAISRIRSYFCCQPQDQIFGPGFEYYGAEIAVVIFRDCSLEKNISIALHKLGMRSANESPSTSRPIEFHQLS